MPMYVHHVFQSSTYQLESWNLEFFLPDSFVYFICQSDLNLAKEDGSLLHFPQSSEYCLIIKKDTLTSSKVITCEITIWVSFMSFF